MTVEQNSRKLNFLSEELLEGARLYHAGRWEESMRKLSAAVADKSNAREQSELAYYLGLCYAKLGEYDNAILYLEQILITSDDPSRIHQCRMLLAYAQLKTGQAQMAEMELKRLKNAGLESASLYNVLAFAAYSQKRYQQAVEHYEKALKLDADNATALNSLGFILADTGMDCERGLYFCRKALQTNPESAAYADSTGWAYYKNGNITEAKKWISLALDAAPGEKEIREHYRIISGISQ